jgi:hypothetical protein
MTDSQRTDAARAALEAYAYAQRLPIQGEYTVIDLITDLLHLAEDEGLDPLAIARKAELHHRAERMHLHIAA